MPTTKRLTFKVLKDTGIIEKKRNGGRGQEIIWKTSEGKKFRVVIHCESYDFQSYGKLYAWNESGNEWNIISSCQPQRDYKIDVAYINRHSYSGFEPIIKDFKKLAKEF